MIVFMSRVRFLLFDHLSHTFVWLHVRSCACWKKKGKKNIHQAITMLICLQISWEEIPEDRMTDMPPTGNQSHHGAALNIALQTNKQPDKLVQFYCGMKWRNLKTQSAQYFIYRLKWGVQTFFILSKTKTAYLWMQERFIYVPMLGF